MIALKERGNTIIALSCYVAAWLFVSQVPKILAPYFAWPSTTLQWNAFWTLFEVMIIAGIVFSRKDIKRDKASIIGSGAAVIGIVLLLLPFVLWTGDY